MVHGPYLVNDSGLHMVQGSRLMVCSINSQAVSPAESGRMINGNTGSGLMVCSLKSQAVTRGQAA